MSTGEVECWGGDVFGEVGDGNSGTPVPRPTIVAGLPGVKAVVSGPNHTCALETAGSVACWGDNVVGEVGNGSTFGGLPGTEPGMLVTTPVPVAGLSGPVMALATGGYRDEPGDTCAVILGGAVECWGANLLGIGPDPNAIAVAPTAVPGLTETTMVAQSTASACAVRANGQVACLGLGPLGQPGQSSSSYSATPVVVPGIAGAVAVAAGAFHACALLGAGTVACWGANTLGALGDGTVLESPTPVTLQGVSGAIAIAAAGFQTCALIADGTVKCWGGLANGSTPTVVPGLANALSVSVSTNGACAVVSGGRIKCWGDDGEGQLGSGEPIIPGSPPVTAPTFVVAGSSERPL